jgi:hypothetical protein
MSKIAFGALAMLLATDAAFAGSDHYGSNKANQPVTTVDHAFTASIRFSETARQNGVDTKAMAAPNWTVLDTVARHNRDDIWGR